MILRCFVLPLSIFLSMYCSVLATRLTNSPTISFIELAPLLLYVGLLAITTSVLYYSRFNGNLSVVSVAMILCGIGMVLQLRVGTLHIGISISQLVYPISIFVLLATYLIGRHGRISRLEPYWVLFMVLALLSICFVMIFGRKYRGAVYLPGNINPVEIVKPLLVVSIATILAGHSALLKRGFLGVPLPPLNIIWTLVIVWSPAMALLILQGDMGMFALLNAVLIVMLYGATRRILYLVGGLAVIIVLGGLLMPLTTRGAARMAAWQDPFSVATGLGWQQLQGLVALYSGGLLGSGIGAGTPTVVPIVESDFVYIVLGEELGFIGCICVVLLYIAFVAAGMKVAENAQGKTYEESVYQRTVATGLTACIAIQSLLNIGGVTTAIPLTGIPLPLLSHGGSSLIATMLMVGILLAISDYTPLPKTAKKKKPQAKRAPSKRKVSRPKSEKMHDKPFGGEPNVLGADSTPKKRSSSSSKKGSH